MLTNYQHKSVLCKEILDFITLKEGDIFVDCTVGCGGHSRYILEKYPSVKLIGIDCDSDAIRCAQENLIDYRDRVTLIHDNFRHLADILHRLKINKINVCLFDLGVSSLQLDDKQRGFSFRSDGPLDMRMDKDGQGGMTASSLINRLDQDKLFEIIKNFGEERFSKRIVRQIIERRKRRPITTTKDLSEIVINAIGKRYYNRIHPATKTFQALRIAVNDELSALKEGLVTAVSFLASGGMIFVISFHSLEDRIAKDVFRNCKISNLLDIITKKPIRPAYGEVLDNPRSRSAKLRIAQKR